MRRAYKLMLGLTVAVGFFVVALASPSLAGFVQYTGTLQSGFADSFHGSISNNGLPVCAQDNRVSAIFDHPIFGPIPIPNVLGKHETGTMYAQGYAETGGGSHASVMFPVFEPLASATGTNIAGLNNVGNGGAFRRVRATCQVLLPPFQNSRFRTRNQFAGGGWPGEAGTVAVNGGMQFGGAGVPGSINIPIPFLNGGAGGAQQITKGARNFGGGVPAVITGPTIYSSFVSSGSRGLGNGVALGINTATLTPTAMAAPLKTYGKAFYLQGYLPTGPNKAGGNTATHRATTDPQALPTGMQTTYTNTFVFRTPGPASGAVQGFVVTDGGGITAGAGCGALPCKSTPFQIRIALQGLTTGKVQHNDDIGDYLTTRGTQGFDLTGASGTGPDGTTRKLSLVAPFSANIKGIGTAGLNIFVPELGFGGIGDNTFNFQPAPVPEPASMLALSFGTMALFGLHRVRRK
jgi:hypothetical protein